MDRQGFVFGFYYPFDIMPRPQRKKQDPAFATIKTPLGTVQIVAGPNGIHMAGKRTVVARKGRGQCDTKYAKSLARAVKELRQYFQGKRKSFTVSVDLSSGTTFQQKVWRELQRIPYGHVITYGELAKKIGNPKAARAVGQAVGSNPNGIIVPCHRVVASGKRIGGWSGGGGIAGKSRLLRLEDSDFFKIGNSKRTKKKR
jgi:methylated-DNA-[protein]-cysteine S-methyltransferase